MNMNILENNGIAFIGSSGFGKSTILKSINRMNNLVESFHKKGQIILEGNDIYDNYDEYKLRKEEWFFKEQILFQNQFMII